MARITYFLAKMKASVLWTHYKIVLFVTSRTVGITFYWYVIICAFIIWRRGWLSSLLQVRKASQSYWSAIYLRCIDVKSPKATRFNPKSTNFHVPLYWLQFVHPLKQWLTTTFSFNMYDANTKLLDMFQNFLGIVQSIWCPRPFY